MKLTTKEQKTIVTGFSQSFFSIFLLLYSIQDIFADMDDQADYDITQYSELTANWHKDPTAFLDCYYSLYYKTVNKEQDPLATNVYVRQSPNKICVLGITNPSTDIESVVFERSLVGEKVKKGTVLCELLNTEGFVIGHVKAEMEGKLLELNTRLEKEGCTLLLNGHHMDTGYIAIIMPKVDNTKVQLAGYQTEEEYKNSLLAENNKTPNLEGKSSCVIS
ncbi:unnamed protein product [Mucor hiemalis]